MPNEQEQFLKDTETDPSKVDVLEQPLVPAESEKTEEDEGAKAGASEDDDSEDGEDGLKPKNRRERRLMNKLRQERESSMFLAGKLEARTEAERALTEEADYLKSIERIYGTDSPEALLATDLLKKAIIGARDDAENRAYERIKTERQREIEEEREAEAELDSMVEEIEDEYGVSLTDTQQRSFFQLLEKMSPKDKHGNVTEYADPHAVWEVFSEKLNKRTKDTRAKDLSSRSMVNSGASKESTLNDDATARYLREQGII